MQTIARANRVAEGKNNGLRGIVDYSDEEVNIAYKTLLIFVAHVIEMSGRLSTDN